MDSAFDGTEAVAKMESSKGKEYDLILMNIQMSGMNGHIAKPIEYSLLFETLRRYQPDEQPSTNPRNEDKDHEYQS